MAEYLCNGYICECGTTLKVFSQDRSTPMRPDPGRGYLVVVTCPQCGKSRSLIWNQIQALPLIWTEQRSGRRNKAPTPNPQPPLSTGATKQDKGNCDVSRVD